MLTDHFIVMFCLNLLVHFCQLLICLRHNCSFTRWCVCVCVQKKKKRINYVGNAKHILPLVHQWVLKHPEVIITGGHRGYDIKKPLVKHFINCPPLCGLLERTYLCVLLEKAFWGVMSSVVKRAFGPVIQFDSEHLY